jgi:hypothetical protein
MTTEGPGFLPSGSDCCTNCRKFRMRDVHGGKDSDLCLVGPQYNLLQCNKGNY